MAHINLTLHLGFARAPAHFVTRVIGDSLKPLHRSLDKISTEESPHKIPLR